MNAGADFRWASPIGYYFEPGPGRSVASMTKTRFEFHPFLSTTYYLHVVLHLIMHTKASNL